MTSSNARKTPDISIQQFMTEELAFERLRKYYEVPSQNAAAGLTHKWLQSVIKKVEKPKIRYTTDHPPQHQISPAGMDPEERGPPPPLLALGIA